MLIEPRDATDDFCSCPQCELAAHHLILEVETPHVRPPLPPEARALMELARCTNSPELYKHYLGRALQLSGGGCDVTDFAVALHPPRVKRECVFCGHRWMRDVS